MKVKHLNELFINQRLKNLDFAILGGGWAGLLCAYELAMKFPHCKITVYEAAPEDSLGGLLRTEVIDGFTFDTGGPHILFSKNKEILQSIVGFLGDNVTQIERNAYVFYREKYVPYPFENGIYILDPETRSKIGTDLIAAMLNNARNPGWSPSTFKDWIYSFFGETMATEYLEPYNWKIWKTNPAEMDASWVFSPGRLPFPSLADIVTSIAGLKSVGYKEQQFFYYPKNGGIKALYDSLLARVKDLRVEILTGYTVNSVRRKGENWLINNQFTSSFIVNTLPLTALPGIFDMPDEISSLTVKLVFTTDVVVGVAIRKTSPSAHVLYVPSPEINFHRLTWMSNLAGSPSPDVSNLIAETTVKGNLNPDTEKIVENTLSGLTRLGIIDSRSEVIFTKSWVNRFGYPVYTLDHVNVRRKIFEHLENIGIFSVGRWGSWHYWNTDKVYEAVQKTVKEIAERCSFYESH